MQLSPRDLSELMIAKLIHDISGAVGAISNGIEYLQEDDSPIKEQAFSLVHESSEQLMARVQFFRIAYGYIYQTTEISISQLQQLANHFFAHSKIHLHWDNAYTDSSGIPLSNKLGKLILNLLVICSACLLEGGNVTFKLERIQDGKQISIIGEGPKILVRPEWLSILTEAHPAISADAKNIQLFYTRQLIEDCAVHFSFEPTTSAVTLTATYTNRS